MANEENVKPEDILAQLAYQQKSLDKLHKDFSSVTTEWLESSAKSEAINQGREIEDRIRRDSEFALKRFQRNIMMFGFILSMLGFLGAPIVIQKVIRDNFVMNIDKHLEKVKKETVDKADKLMEKARIHDADLNTKFADYKNHLIVLQTDFGAESPYMGQIKGAIYRFNPYARIDVITDQVEPFDIFDAAWTLSKAVKYYPENTIFVSITGDVKNASPIIFRNNKKRHTFIGYSNGVFDLVRKTEDCDKTNYLFGCETYKVNLKKLKIEWKRLKGWLTEEQSKHLKPEDSAYIGFIAGTLSNTPIPWELDYQNDDEKFSWENVWESATFQPLEKFKSLEPVLIPSDDSVLIQGLIMSIDSFGNADTNISRVFLENQLDAKSLTFDDNSQFKVGIFSKNFNPRLSDESQDGFKLETVKFPTNYSSIKDEEPFLIVERGKLQLAINKGNFSMSDKLLVNYRTNCVKENIRCVEPQMKVWVHVSRIPEVRIKN